MRRRLQNLPFAPRRRAESGQSLVFAAFTMFALLIVVLAIVGVGDATSNQMRLQNAADSASLTGAQVEADCLSQICWLNEGMERIYYHSLRYATDTATYGVLAELAEFEPDWTPDGLTTLGGGGVLPGAAPGSSPAGESAIVGVDGAAGKWREAYDQGREWIPRGEVWLRRLSRIERGVAALAPALVKHQVYYTAQENLQAAGVEEKAARIAIYPSFRMLPDANSGRLDLDVEKTPTSGAWPIDPAHWYENGWHAYSTSHNLDMVFDHTVHQLHNNNPDKPDLDRYHLETSLAGHTSLIDFESDFDWGWAEKEGKTRPCDYQIDYTAAGGTSETWRAHRDEDGNLTVIGGGGVTEIEQHDGYFTIIKDGKKTNLRWSDTGMLETGVDTDHDGIPDKWTPLADKTSTTVDGVEIPVTFNVQIPIDQTEYGLVQISLENPITIWLLNMHVTFSDPVRITYHTPAGWLNLEDDRALINGLSTLNPSRHWQDWDYHGPAWTQNEHDRIRHRLYTVSEKHWKYEYVVTGTYCTDMNMRKFASHGFMDHDPYYRTAAGEADDYWCPPNPEAEGIDDLMNDDAVWKESAGGRWARFPLWATPPREPADDYDGTGDFNYGGWMNIETGAPRDATTFSQTRECWYCGDKGVLCGPLGDTAEALVNMDPTLYPDRDADYNSRFYPAGGTVGKKLPRPCGFWHEGPWPQDDEGLGRLHAYTAALSAAGASFVIFSTPGAWWVQVRCPCGCRHEFNHFPKRYVADPTQTVTRVRRYLQHACGRHHAASRPSDPSERTIDQGYDPAADASDPRDPLTDPANLDCRDFFSIKYDPANLKYWDRALDITSEVFRNGLAVGVWLPATSGQLWQKVGQSTAHNAATDAASYNPLSPPGWGRFAVTSSRLFTLVQGTDGRNPTWQDNFSWADNDTLAFPGEDPLDELGRAKNWRREYWVRSALNAFEPGWRATVAPLDKALDLRDFYSVEELEGGEVTDNNTALIFNFMQSAYWFRDVLDTGYGMRWMDTRVGADWNRMSAPPMQGDQHGHRIDWRDPGIKDVTKH